MELDIIVKANSALISAPPIPETKKSPFTADEIKAVWSIKNQEWVDSILTFLYMGWRISELLDIRVQDVNITDNTITGGTKTKSGKNRVVPIHPKLLPFILERCKESNEYLFSYNNKHCSAYQYYIFWNDIMKQLNITHTPPRMPPHLPFKT